MKRAHQNHRAISALVILLVFAVSLPLSHAASVNLGTGEGSAGGSVTIPITLSGGSGIAATSMDISYERSQLANPSAEIGPSAQSADKKVFASTTPEGLFRIGVVGMNLNEIPDGVVATISFDVLADAASGKTVVVGNVPSGSDAKGNAIGISGRKGVITVK